MKVGHRVLVYVYVNICLQVHNQKDHILSSNADLSELSLTGIMSLIVPELEAGLLAFHLPLGVGRYLFSS